MVNYQVWRKRVQCFGPGSQYFAGAHDMTPILLHIFCGAKCDNHAVCFMSSLKQCIVNQILQIHCKPHLVCHSLLSTPPAEDVRAAHSGGHPPVTHQTLPKVAVWLRRGQRGTGDHHRRAARGVHLRDESGYSGGTGLRRIPQQPLLH